MTGTRKRSRLLALCGLLCLSPIPGKSATPPQKPLASLEDKPFGVLLLGEGGDKVWKDSVASIIRDLSKKFPIEFVFGEADVKLVQKSVESLQAARIKKLVVVPLFLTSHSPLMDETRFLFGINENPSPSFFKASRASAGYALVRRAQTKLPVVLTPALDDSRVVVDILASRALSLSRNPSDEALVIVGIAPAFRENEEKTLGPAKKIFNPMDEYGQSLTALAERVRAQGGFQAAAGAALSDSPLQSQRDRTDDDLRRLVRGMSLQHRVLVVPHALTGILPSRRILRALGGVFMRYNEKGLLPDDRIERWIEESARQGAAKPDMRIYKDAGKPLSPAPAFPRARVQDVPK